MESRSRGTASDRAKKVLVGSKIVAAENRMAKGRWDGYLGYHGVWFPLQAGPEGDAKSGNVKCRFTLIAPERESCPARFLTTPGPDATAGSLSRKACIRGHVAHSWVGL